MCSFIVKNMRVAPQRLQLISEEDMKKVEQMPKPSLLFASRSWSSVLSEQLRWLTWALK